MKIYTLQDAEFSHYGKIVEGYDTAALIKAMEEIELPQEGVAYEPAIKALEECEVFSSLQNHAFGGMPIELGMCWGRNTRLNCLEYHRDSELNLGTHDFVLLLARQDEIDADGTLDTSHVKAFYVPAGVLVEVYATTLHYAPCHVDKQAGFRVAVVLPRGTNTEVPKLLSFNQEDRRLWACNKWLLAHAQSSEAEKGAFIGLRGENIDICGQLLK